MKVSTTIDSGHGTVAFLTGGGGPSREHGWFGHTTLIGGPGPNQLIGLAGKVKFKPTKATDLIFAGKPRRRTALLNTLPPGGTYYRFVHGHLVPIPASEVKAGNTKANANSARGKGRAPNRSGHPAASDLTRIAWREFDERNADRPARIVAGASPVALRERLFSICGTGRATDESASDRLEHPGHHPATRESIAGARGAARIWQNDASAAGASAFGPPFGRVSFGGRAPAAARGGAVERRANRRPGQGWALGEEVGYQVRFERRLSSRTRLRFLTEGVLTRQLLADPFLEGVGAVILDEFHERNLNSDLALALLRQVRREVRPDLILMVMSATLDPRQVSDYLDGCPIARVDGRSFDVSVQYRPVSRPADAALIGPLIEERLSEKTDPGHLLVFLPGFAEIRRLARWLAPAAASAGALVLPLHGSLSALEQDRALLPSDRRKIILSTNVAETSLTIDGVTTVIDCGLARIVRYDGVRGIDRWETSRISRASADQRAGRAGRTGPGTCIRLWSEREHRGRPEFEQPEIHRVDLSSSVLALHAWGVTDPATFDWFDAPNPERLAEAERLLRLLGAVDGDPPRITPMGEAMLALPVHPRLARLLVAARECNRARDGATIAALLSEKDIRLNETRERTDSQGGPRLATRSESDILDRLDLMFEAEAAGFTPSLRSRGIDPAQARQVARLRDDLLGRSSERDACGEIERPQHG